MTVRDGRAARSGRLWGVLVGIGMLGGGAGDGLAASDSRAWGADPFRDPPAPVDRQATGTSFTAESPLDLQGIMAGPGGMVAIIDSRIVRIGDRIGAERVVEMTPRTVVLQRGQQTRRLEMSVLVTRGR